MRKFYKYLIVIATCIVLLTCSVISVGAASYSRRGTVSSKELYNAYFEGFPSGSRSWFVTSNYFDNRNNFSAESDNGSNYISGGGLWSFLLPVKPFNFDPFEDYHITFNFGNWFLRGFNNSYTLRMAITSGATTLDYEIFIDKSNGSSGSPDLVYFDCFLPKSFIGANDGYFMIELTVISNFAGTLSYNPSIYVSNFDYSCESNEEAAINNAVGTITGGWESSPETPDNAEDVGELGSIEEQLQSGSEEGINAGMNMITNLGTSLAGFQKGFVFMIDLFDEFTGEISWISSVLTIGLALGIVAFLLNIVGSVASKISRDERRNESERRRQEAADRRAKQNKR